jgi:hypothetical protein
MAAFISPFIRCMRPKQWTKNAFLFAGPLFTGRFPHHPFALRVALGFAAFCLLSGVVYVINDIIDAEQDRRHPRKCRRPIASGELSVAAALPGTGLASLWRLGRRFVRGDRGDLDRSAHSRMMEVRIHAHLRALDHGGQGWGPAVRRARAGRGRRA